MPVLRASNPAALACLLLAPLLSWSGLAAQPGSHPAEPLVAHGPAFVPHAFLAPSVPWPEPTALAAAEPGLEDRADLGPLRPAPESFGRMFFEGWALIAGIEASLLAVTLLMPSSFSGWEFEDGLVRDGLQHLGEAWTKPPVWDTDHWFHNYVGHPYGGSIYYNTVRVKGATRVQSFLFAGAMSFWWEYALEGMAERPSIQDIVITPVAGALLGEFVHRTTLNMRANGTSILEKAFILVFNPTHLVQQGWNRP